MIDMADSSHPRLSLAGVWEQIYPLVCGTLAAAAWLWWGNRLVILCDIRHWHLDAIYTIVFGFLAVTTGFLATFYGTIQCMSEGFIQRIRNTRVMQGFLVFTKRAIIMGFVVSMITIPMMITAPLPREQFETWSFVVAAWLGATVWALAGFYRVASMFFFLFETRPGSGHPGG